LAVEHGLSVPDPVRVDAPDARAPGQVHTTYAVSDQRVLGVSPDGLVTARGNGSAEVKVLNEHANTVVSFTVAPPGLATSAAPTGP
jgi:hypothetical protein